MTHQKSDGRAGARLLFFFLRGSLHLFIISILSTFAMTLLGMLTPQVISFTVDTVLGDIAPELSAPAAFCLDKVGGLSYLRENLWLIALLIAAIGVLSAICLYITRVSNVHGASVLVKRMQDLLFSHIGHLPYAWHMKNQTGDIIQRCTSDVEMVKMFVAGQLTSLLRTVSLLILSMYFMF